MNDSLFLRACRGEATERVPVWIMRQAGRYLPEYRALRERVSFLELCRTPELILEATMQPIRRFRFDAAIIFSDILLPLTSMGLDLRFDEGAGPRITNPVRDRSAIRGLEPLDTRRDLPFVPEAARLLVRELGPTPLIGFAGAPFTVASYAVEGGTSKSFATIKSLIFSDPEAAHELFRRLTDGIVDFIDAQLEAGASAFQLFDSWGGVLSRVDYRTFCMPYVTEIFDRLRGRGAPGILFVNGGNHLLDILAEAGSDVVGVDWRTDLTDARRRLGGKALQGNLDPAVLFGPDVVVTERTRATLEDGTRGAGYIFNLGHGILPTTPVARVETLLRTVRSFVRPDRRDVAGIATAGSGMRGRSS